MSCIYQEEFNVPKYVVFWIDIMYHLLQGDIGSGDEDEYFSVHCHIFQ